MKKIPLVFISSTSEDLKPYREAARDAAIEAGFHPVMMEYFAAGGNPPLKTCLDKVKPCDVLVVISAHRYGWIPPGDRNHKKKSITWLECEQAEKDGKEVLAFLVDEKQSWPEELKENYRLIQALNEGKANNKLFADVNFGLKKFKEFKEWLKNQKTASFFKNEDHLKASVLHSLGEWKNRQGKAAASKRTVLGKLKPLEIPKGYREWMMKQYGTIELLAHLQREGSSPKRLSSVYVPAPTVPWELEKKPKKGNMVEPEEKLNLLLDRFGKESLYVPGAAGSGKSTFVRWVSFLLLHGEMPLQVQMEGEKPIVEVFPKELIDKLPVIVPFREFWPFIAHYSGQRDMGFKELEEAIQNWSVKKLEGIDWKEIGRFIEKGKAVLLFDGADETPVSIGEGEGIYHPRQMILSGLKAAVPKWIGKGNRILLTSRPYGFEEDDTGAMGLRHSEITDLPEPLQHLFVTRWFKALDYPADMASQMLDHLADREELSPLVGHPVLLMAMCILFCEGKRLPEDKTELYEKTVDRLLYNRYEAEKAEKVKIRLSVVAHGMHTGEGLGETRKTPQAEVRHDEMDSILSDYMEKRSFTEKGFTDVSEAREELLSRSGLLVQKDVHAASFYHFSFQEYLAGRRINQVSGDQLESMFENHSEVPEWRPTLGFLFGFSMQNPDKSMSLLARLIEEAPARNLAHLTLISDLAVMVYRKGYRLEKKIEDMFKELCLEAIRKEVPIHERYDIGRALGVVGDPRIAVDLRHAPQGYIEIPAGVYLLGDEKKRQTIEKLFLLSKYPVTNGQYRIFIDEGGYGNDTLWSDKGRKWRDKVSIRESRFWRNSRWNGENLPVVGVSWYEAEAFCNWAGGRLPRETEWEAAARGPTGRKYPWGDEWGDGICNSYESNLHKTSPVGLYPRSASRDFKVEDMTGNVWEWCSDWFDKDEDTRVLRGGSFSYSWGSMRCAVRGGGDPLDRGSVVGFRVVCGVES